MTHGGKRVNAGRPPMDILVSRVYKLHDDGMSAREIAIRFNVSKSVINRLIKRREIND